MSTTITTSTSTEKYTARHAVKPSFFGLVRGELFKARRQLTTWIMFALTLVMVCVPYLFVYKDSSLKDAITSPNADYFISLAPVGLAVLRIFSGFFLAILTARMIGQEYSQGTIRIILARGVGRVQLLLAKWTAIVTWAVIVLVLGLALSLLMVAIQVQVATGSLTPLTSLDASIWSAYGLYVLSVAISMGATILMASAVTGLLRSLAGGMTFSIIWFPADNIIVGILTIAFLVTKSTFWTDVSAYLLGPNLNVMAGLIAKQNHQVWMFGAPPATPPISTITVDGTHTLVVTAVYAAIFLFVALFFTWKRDVKE